MNNFKTTQNYQTLKRRQLAKGYRYLIHKPGRKLEDCLITSEKISGADFIIRDTTPGYCKLYYKYNNYAQYSLDFPEGVEHKSDECIQEYMRQHPKYDLDNYADFTHVQEIINVIWGYFYTRHNKCVEIIITDSSGIDSETGIKKNSCHLIIPEIVFKNSTDANFASSEIFSLIDPTFSYCFDHGINSKGGHNLRTPLSTKNGRTKQVPIGYTREDLMITCGLGVGDSSLDTKQCHEITIERPEDKSVFTDFSANQDIDLILKLAEDWLVGWTFDKLNGSFINFTRECGITTDCKLCGREHTGDNSRSLLIGRDGISLCCGKAKGKRQLIIPAHKIPGYSGKINEAVQMMKTEVAAKVAEKKKRVRKPADPTKIINDHVMNVPKEYLLAAKYNFVLHETYDEAAMREFPTDPRTLYVRANMKMGKTKGLINYMAGSKTIVLISVRRTYSRQLLTKLRSHGFVSYQDIKENNIDLLKYPRVIIQVQSLHRLLHNTPPNLIVLDESEAIFAEFTAETMSNKTAEFCARKFQGLLEKAGRLIALDANLDHCTIDLIRQYRGADGEFLVQNTHKNMAADKIHIMFKKVQLIDAIMASIEAGENIVVPTNCLSVAKEIREFIATKIPADQILLLSSETGDIERSLIFANVDDHWAKYRAVIYTPTCGAGISFEKRHFNKVFAYFTTASTNVEAWCQALYRARDISSREYYVCINAKNSVNIPTIDAMKNIIRMKNQIYDSLLVPLRYDIVDNPDGTFTRAWTEDFYFNLYANVKLAENKTQSQGLAHFIHLCAIKGATIDAHIAAVGATTAADLRSITADIKAADYEKIASAADLTPKQITDLSLTTVRTTDEKLSMTKLGIKNAYDYSSQITTQFMKTYASESMIRIARNLRTALKFDCMHKSIDTVRIRSKKENTDRSVHRDYYLRLKIACDIITQCGFDHFCDQGTKTKAEMKTNLTAIWRPLELAEGLIELAFPGKGKINNWNFTNGLKYINGILEVVFGCKIKCRGHPRLGIFEISHKIYGPLITTTPVDDRPSIIRGWQTINDAPKVVTNIVDTAGIELVI